MVYELFWTGGFDSTFRLCQLAREGRVVQPYYVVHPLRKSVGKEIGAHKKILAYLTEKGLGTNVFPVRYVSLGDIWNNFLVSDAYARIRGNWVIGGQYEWLARFALSHPGIEVCHEGFVNRQGALGKLLDTAVKRRDGLGRICVDTEKSDRDLSLLFGCFSFPIIELNNVRMMDMLKEWGMDDVVDLITFCESGRDGNCGVCSCCRGKFSTGVFGRLFSEKAKKRYLIHSLLGDVECFLRFAKGDGSANYLQSLYVSYAVCDMDAFSFLLCFDLRASERTCALFGKLEGMSVKNLRKFFSKCRTDKGLYMSVGFNIARAFPFLS